MMIGYEDGDCFWESVSKINFDSENDQEIREIEVSKKRKKEKKTGNNIEKQELSKLNPKKDTREIAPTQQIQLEKPRHKEIYFEEAEDDPNQSDPLSYIQNRLYPNQPPSKSFSLSTFCDSVDLWRKESFQSTQIISLLKSIINQQNQLIKTLVESTTPQKK